MKKEEKDLVLSTYELLEVYTQAATPQANEELVSRAREQLRKLLFMSERNTSSKINIFDFCAKDNIHPELNHVLYDIENKQAVACNSRVLLISKSDYVDYTASGFKQNVYGNWGSDGHPCYLVSKKGEPYSDRRYPNYPNVLPNIDSCTEIEIDIDRLRNCIKRERFNIKTLGEAERAICIGEQYFNLKEAEFIARFSGGHWYYRDPTAALTFVDDNYHAIFMPTVNWGETAENAVNYKTA